MTTNRCTYPDCNCPFDHPGTEGWCARGLPAPTASQESAEDVVSRAVYLSAVEKMEEARSDYATLTAELAEAREQRDRWIREAGENMDIAFDIIAERDAARDECESLREALREAVGWNWLDDDAPPLDVVLKIDAALSASGREGE